MAQDAGSAGTLEQSVDTAIFRGHFSERFQRQLSLTKRDLRLTWRRLSGARKGPDIFVIGAQKAGTTSLHDYMSRHPQLLPPIVKEVHYFDQAYGKGIGWYNAHFPGADAARAIEDRIGAPTFAFDTTPYYLFHPHASERIRRYQPNARLIALLRDPVQRSWSHYRYEKMRGFEALEPEAAFAAEAVRVPDPHHVYGDIAAARFMHQHYTYCARSEYDVQVERWLGIFPREQMLILRAEDLFSRPRETLARVWRFLGVAHFELDDYGSLNQGEYKKLPEGIAGWLGNRLAPSIARCVEVFTPDAVD